MCKKKIIIEIDKKAAAVKKNKAGALEDMCEKVLKACYGTGLRTVPG